MDNQFFERPILNSPYELPARHWELDPQGQPTQQIVESRRRAEFITPIPKPKKQKQKQESLVFDEGKGLSTQKQQYDPTPIINELRYQVDQWRKLSSPSDWLVSPETATLLQPSSRRKSSRAWIGAALLLLLIVGGAGGFFPGRRRLLRGPGQRLQAECSDPGAPHARKTQEGVAGCAYQRHGYWYG